MGEIIDFPSNGSTGQRLYRRAGQWVPNRPPGIVVLQEWWGLVDQIKRTCDRFADAGFTALAPDLYHGTTVPLTEPDEAGKQMMALKMDAAAKDLSGAVDELIRRTGGLHVGVVGFCMGGGLALVLGHPAPRRGQGRGPGLRAHPVARRPARLLDAGRGRPGACRRTGRLLHPGRGPRARGASSTGLGKDVEFHHLPRRRPRLLQRGPARGATTRESAELLWDRTVGFFRRNAGLSRSWLRRPVWSSHYLTLGLRLGRHIDGLVDAYYGPPALAGGRRRRAGAIRPSIWWPRPGRCWPPSTPASRSTRRRRGGRGRRESAGPPPLAPGPGRRAAHHGPQAGRRADRLRRRGRGLLRRAPDPGGRGGAVEAHRRLDEVLPGIGSAGRAAGRLAGVARRSRSTGSGRPSTRWPRTCASGPAPCSACPTASTSSSSW